MRYASIRNFDISNGAGCGVALFVQGCHFHCKNCFNQSTWDFSGGKEFTAKIKNQLYSLLENPHITRLSVLGGEPLAKENIETVKSIIKDWAGKKEIWVYTGYIYEVISDKELLNYVDFLVDGQYEDELRDLNLAFRGSSNQRVIDVKNSLAENKVVTKF